VSDLPHRDLHAVALETIDAAAELLGLEPWLAATLRRPERAVTVEIPYPAADGTIRSVRGYRVQHSTARGPAKGGIRFHPDVTIEEVTGLATLMSVKTALLDLPLGGGKGGVTVDPRGMTDAEVEAITRGYARAIAGVIGPDVDVPAPDVNTGTRHMDWIADEYGHLVGSPTPAVVTGKSLAAGGSLGRDTATAAGCRTVTLRAAKQLGLPADARVAIQGYGNAGAHLARMLAADGLRVVAVSDSRGGVHRPDGLDLAAVGEAKHAHGSVTAYVDADVVTNEELLAVDCEILVPAALEGAIAEREATRVRARLVAEAANGPCTPEADLVLAERDVVVLPDVLASAGGVTVSCFEWQQNRDGSTWTEARVAAELDARMQAAFDALWDYAAAQRLPLRLAAVALGVQRVAAATRQRHAVPTAAPLAS
jgi:glutamate dehydrogenase/leucine dehydrogenase